MSRLVMSLVVSVLGLLFTAVVPAFAHAAPMQAEHAMAMHAALPALPCHGNTLQETAKPERAMHAHGLSQQASTTPGIHALSQTGGVDTCLHAAHTTHEHAMPCCTASGQSPVATAGTYQLAVLRPLPTARVRLPHAHALPAGQGVTPLLPPPRPSIA
ncbi:hypothetical protein [Acetobacter papayae]|uniref:hypothetical protein n=1 Tax=Acetobacter papayae TaxID=1076592 RepID=UPI0011DC96E4|nr:hypothetical protein [Acetobacter papayae]